MSITRNEPRIGNFTSSEIADLLKNGRAKDSLGAPALTYIEEKNMERRLGRSLDNETNARALTWGQLIEKYVFEQLGLEYKLCSAETITHPEHSFWAGSPDATKEDTVCDMKSPITLKSFCQLVDPLYDGLTGIEAMNVIRENHKDGEKYYWQLVSNAILTGSKFAELIVYVPYLSELTKIREFAAETDLENAHRYYWVNNAVDDELPYLEDGGFYKNINIIRFEVPEADKQLLTARVISCAGLLKPFPNEKENTQKD